MVPTAYSYRYRQFLQLTVMLPTERVYFYYLVNDFIVKPKGFETETAHIGQDGHITTVKVNSLSETTLRIYCVHAAMPNCSLQIQCVYVPQACSYLDVQNIKDMKRPVNVTLTQKFSAIDDTAQDIADAEKMKHATIISKVV